MCNIAATVKVFIYAYLGMFRYRFINNVQLKIQYLAKVFTPSEIFHIVSCDNHKLQCMTLNIFSKAVPIQANIASYISSANFFFYIYKAGWKENITLQYYYRLYWLWDQLWITHIFQTVLSLLFHFNFPTISVRFSLPATENLPKLTRLRVQLRDLTTGQIYYWHWGCDRVAPKLWYPTKLQCQYCKQLYCYDFIQNQHIIAISYFTCQLKPHLKDNIKAAMMHKVLIVLTSLLKYKRLKEVFQ